MPRIFGSASTGGGGTPGGSTTQVQFNNAGAFGGITGATTDGTTLTLVAPVLGTPASATLTNATGLPPSTGLSTFVAPAKGGLGAALTPVIGDILYADSTTSFARLAAPAVGQVLKSNGVGAAPTWSASPSLTSLTLSNGTSTAPVFVGGASTSGLYFANSGFDVGYVRAGSPQAILGFQKIVQTSLGVFGIAPSTDPTATPDVGLSRISAGVIGVGTGAQGSTAAELRAAKLTLGAFGNSSALGVTAYSLTGSDASSMLDLAGTWNTTGVPTAIKLNINNTASGTGALLIDAQVGGVTKFNVLPNGNIRQAGNGYAWVLDTNTSANQLTFSANGVASFGAVDGNGLKGGSKVLSAASTLGATSDLFLTRPAAATWQHGEQDAAAPIAQTIKFQDVVAGTANTAGVNATIQAPAGTGTGAGGSLIFQVAAAGSTGSAKNAWATALTIDSTKTATFAGTIVNTGAGVQVASGGVYSFNGGVSLYSGGAGRLAFDGVTSSHPMWKRSATSLQAKLADDSAFTAIQGKLTTDTAYVATPQSPTGYITIYDSTGTAYKVSVNV